METETADRESVDAIRQAERHKLADLIDRDAETIAEFAADKVAAVKLCALLLRVGVREDA